LEEACTTHAPLPPRRGARVCGAGAARRPALLLEAAPARARSGARTPRGAARDAGAADADAGAVHSPRTRTLCIMLDSRASAARFPSS
jgi:hypothetical protein